MFEINTPSNYKRFNKGIFINANARVFFMVTETSPLDKLQRNVNFRIRLEKLKLSIAQKLYKSTNLCI